MADLTCLAEGMVFPADFHLTGINQNEMIVGPTGCGKSFSTAYPRLLHTTESSVVIPIAKGALKNQFSKMFEERGYKVVNMDFVHPEKSNAGYDPMMYIRTDEDVVNTARNLIGTEASRGRGGEMDPYWNESATSILAAEIALVRLEADYRNKRASFSEVVKLHRRIVIKQDTHLFETNMDERFDYYERIKPGNQASELWKTIRGLAPRTASCIFSIVNSAVDKITSESVLTMMEKRRPFSFKTLGEKKIALFITTSPVNLSLQRLVNLMYADMFKILFETAEKQETGRLKIPVHIICDDFACGSRINNFANYISIFRAAGISVTMLLQSETQLNSMYGENEATTIINNCDTYVYMGGMDIATCRNMSQRTNKPVDKIMALPLEQVIVLRRGMTPVVARRYQVLDDPVYGELMMKGAAR